MNIVNISERWRECECCSSVVVEVNLSPVIKNGFIILVVRVECVGWREGVGV